MEMQIEEQASILEDSLNSFTQSLSIVIPEPNFNLPIEVYGEYGPLPMAEAEQFKIKRSK
jgi:hypothetical protein